MDHIAVIVSSIESACEWYKEKLGAEIARQDKDWAMLTIPNSSTKLALTKKGSHPPHFAINRDLTTVDEAKFHRDGSKYLYISDPDGNVIELIDWVGNDREI